MSLRFTALDFETANSYRGSPCSVGLAKVRDGQVVSRAHFLIRPPQRFGHFDPFNIWLHGIDEQAVRDAPPWQEALQAIMEFIGQDVAVCHNAAFDIGVLRYACIADEIPWPTLSFFCTLNLARRCFSLPSYRLPFVADACGIELGVHHHALDDAEMAAQILLAIAQQTNAETCADVARAHQMHIGRMSTGSYTLSIPLRLGGRPYIPETNTAANPDHPYFGRVVVFTGTLMSMTRQIAFEEIARVGGTPARGVTRHTDALVIGDINPAVLAPGNEWTARAAKAFTLREKGYVIEIQCEDDFLRYL